MSEVYAEEETGRIRPQMAATIAVIAVNVIVYLLQGLARQMPTPFPMDEYFALSVDGLRHGYVWQLITFQFMHGSLLHIGLNMWAIFLFGRVIETTIGWRRMLTLYFLSGIVGGLAQVVGFWLLPGIFGEGAIIGASAGASGLLAAFAVLYPDQVLYLFLFFIIPLRMRAATMLWVWVGISVFGIFMGNIGAHLFEILQHQEFFMRNFGRFSGTIGDAVASFANVAHAGHLGGTAMGYFIARSLIRRHRAPPIIVPPKSPLNINPASE